MKDLNLSRLPEFLDTRHLCELLGVTRETLRAYTRRGVVPAPLALSKRRLVWSRDAIEAHLKGRMPA